MSASTGQSSKGEKGKSKYQSLDINSIYNNTRSEASEVQQTKNTVQKKYGMQQLGKVPQRRPPANLPSLKSENSGNDPSISLVPAGGTGWGVKAGESQQLTAGGGGNSGAANNMNSQNSQSTQQQTQSNVSTGSPAPAAGLPPASVSPSIPTPSQQSPHDKTWSSVTGGSQASSLGLEHGPSFLAHQSPQFQQEFPSLSGEPGGAPAHPTTSYGPGPSLRPQTEPASWSQGTHPRPQPQQPQPPQNHHLVSQFKAVVPSFLLSSGSGFPMFPENIQSKRSRSQANHSDNRMLSGGGNRSGVGAGGHNTGGESDELMSRPIIKEEDLNKMEDLVRDVSWAANDDIDYNEQLSFSDGESVGENEKEKESNKVKDKLKQSTSKEDKNDMMDKMNRDKGYMNEKDRAPQPWRIGNNSSFSEFRNVPKSLVQGARVDDEEVWKERRRQCTENKMAAAEKAKQRKEEEEKRHEETKAKKSSSDFHINITPTISDREERAKTLENFRQMTQFQMEGRPNANRERDREQRDMRRDRDNQFSNRQQNKPPRFRQHKDAAKMQQYSGDSNNDMYINSFRLRGGAEPMDKDDDFHKDRHDRQISESNSDRSGKDFSNRDMDKEWETKGESESQNFDDRIRRESKSMNDNFSKSNHMEENEWRERPQRQDRTDMRLDHRIDPRDNKGDTRDRVDCRDNRMDSRDNRMDNRDNRMDKRGGIMRDNRLESRVDIMDSRLDSRHDIRLDNRSDDRPDRPSRPESRDSRVSRESRNSKDSSEKPSHLEVDYAFTENYFDKDKVERLSSFKDKEYRTDPVGQRPREHVPGPITPAKMVAYEEHKQNQSQMEKNETQIKDSEDKKFRTLVKSDAGTDEAWSESHGVKTSLVQDSIPPQESRTALDFSVDENKTSFEMDDNDKIKENGRERKEENKMMGGGSGVGGNRGNRMRNGGRSGYSQNSKYMYSNLNWQMKDRGGDRLRGGASRGRTKHWNPSESDGSGDDINAQSGKEDKKPMRKPDGSSKFGTWKSDKIPREDKNELKGCGNESDKERLKGDKKGSSEGSSGEQQGKKGGDNGGFAPLGKPSRRGRGSIIRGQSRLPGTSFYGPPGSKPFSSPNQSNPQHLDSQDKQYSQKQQSDNGFQEVKSKKTGREGQGEGGKQEVKRSRSKGKEKGSGGVKMQPTKSYTREFVNNKPPRMQRLDNNRQQQMAQHDVSDMNKINQNVSSLFPVSRGNDVSSSCPPPPAHNAWNKPINASLRTTPPLSTTLTQLATTPAPPPPDKTNLDELGPPSNTAHNNSPTTEKNMTKITREVEKSMLDGPPVNTIIFENTNYKRDPGDIGMKPRYAMKGPGRNSLDKTRDRKIEDELSESTHSISLGGFKSANELQSADGKQPDNIQVPISFSKNEDNADMKLDFAFDSDLSQLSDDKTNQSMHVGQSSAADLNQKIASVKKVWDSAPGMSGHVDEGSSSSFTQGFTTDKTLDHTNPSHHSDHSDFNSPDSVYGSGGQLSAGGGYVAAPGGSMMKPDTIVSAASTMCKSNMFQVSPQPQQVTVMPHPGPLSTPPPIPNVLSFQPGGYSGNLSAVPSPPNVLYNSPPTAGPQTEIYQAYSLGSAQMHGSGSRSYQDFPPPSYNMSQNSTFQPSVYMQSAPPPNPQSVFQNTQYRLPHGSAAALSQQMNSNPSTMLMSSSSNSVVSGSQVKSSQGSMQPTAIGSKSGGGPPTATFPPHSAQILLLEPSTAVSFLHQGYHRPAAAIQHSSSYFTANSPLATGGNTGGLFNSASLLSSGASGATTGSLPSAASHFGVQAAAASYNQQQPPSSTQPPTPHQQPPYPTQPQIGGSFRSQAGYPKTNQHPSESAKSSQDQFQSMFTQVTGSPKPRVNVVKPQPSASPQPQQHKFSPYNANVSQSNLGYQQQGVGGNNGGGRQGQQQVMRSSGSAGGPPQTRYISPIQRPMAPNFSQQQQQAAMMQQQQVMRQQHRMQPRPPSVPQQQPKQYYQQQGGGMKLEGNESVKNDMEDQNKTGQDKAAKDDHSSDQ